MAWGYGDSYQNKVYNDDSDSKAAGVVTRSPGGSIMSGGTSWSINPNGPDLIARPNDTGGGKSSSRGGGSSSGSGTKSSTTRTTFNGEAPTMGALPTLTMPKVDKRRIRALSQEAAAPAVRKLREGLQSAMNISTDNPNVRRMTLREALQGYGTGLEGAMSGASQQARAEHQQELNLLSTEAQQNYKTAVEKTMAEYDKAYNAWLKSATVTTDVVTNEGDAAGGDTVVRRNAWGTPEVGPSFGSASSWMNQANLRQTNPKAFTSGN